jgi:hypothetical protein
LGHLIFAGYVDSLYQKFRDVKKGVLPKIADRNALCHETQKYPAPFGLLPKGGYSDIVPKNWERR